MLGAVAMLVAGAASACTAETERAADSPTPAQEPAMTQHSNGESRQRGVANLPYARGRIFYSLDEYLAHLESNGTIDLPYWREIEPGVYEYVVRMPGAERQVATRDELMRRYGFSR